MAKKNYQTRVDIAGALKHLSENGGKELTAYGLAKETGIPQMSLIKWERGEGTKTLNDVYSIARFTGYPLSKLIIQTKKT